MRFVTLYATWSMPIAMVGALVVFGLLRRQLQAAPFGRVPRQVSPLGRFLRTLLVCLVGLFVFMAAIIPGGAVVGFMTGAFMDAVGATAAQVLAISVMIGLLALVPASLAIVAYRAMWYQRVPEQG